MFHSSNYSHMIVNMVVLCIVDMQTHPTKGFPAADDEFLIADIQGLIFDAVRKGDIIVFVRYSGFGKTDRRIKGYCAGYSKVHYVRKDDQDGSEKIAGLLRKSKYSSVETEKIYVCGVYTHACVKRTAWGLAKEYPNSNVVVLENYTRGTREESLTEVLTRQRLDTVKDNYGQVPSNLFTRKRRT